MRKKTQSVVKRSHFVESVNEAVRPEKRRKSKRRWLLQTGGILLSLAGVLACGQLGLGAGRVLCHGILVAALGVPMHKVVGRQGSLQ